ncbi:DUF6596 domain-containing protein [Nocardia otitidiscaviarum]|uniref:DUF6596 domain-containing protein n=1 Tax=Nocardia otitidiscaviarum TaxID=1823 RepID=UPI0039814916
MPADIVGKHPAPMSRCGPTGHARAAIPDHDEVSGALALMLLTHARAAARVADNRLIPLAEQDRSCWDGTHAVRAHLLEMAGDEADARSARIGP